jgi:NADPH:quinone reductase-like Zn-dependent oxidoreductase
MPVRDNIVPLSDGAGEVVEAGGGVTHVKVGDKVFLLQGAGGVSIFGVQNWRMQWGVQVVITSSSDEKLARAKNLGANKGINYKSRPDWEGRDGIHRGPRRRSGGRDRRCRHMTRSFGAIWVGGKISLVGGLSGPATELNPGLILARRRAFRSARRRCSTMNRAIAANGITGD